MCLMDSTLALFIGWAIGMLIGVLICEVGR